MSPAPTDRFDTAALRSAVLEAWRTSPTRYREDANVEEDYALGGYRDRLYVELVQNAVDAARAAGVPARVLIELGDDALVVANSGVPLDRAGVESLSAMRASAKRGDGSVGRFGVGFAAVLAVTDCPAITSGGDGVCFSRDETVAVMAQDPRLAAELADRPPPVLRLPFPYLAPDRLADGYDTAVVLPWRDAAARDHAGEALASIDDALFVALPDLVEVQIVGAPPAVPGRWQAATEGDVLKVRADDAVRRWRLCRAGGDWSDVDLAQLPAEVGVRRHWSLTWAFPVDAEGRPGQWPSDPMPGGWPRRVLHAPTPTDEALALPGLLVGDFPVDPTRRRLAEGDAVDAMLRAAVDSYVVAVRDAASRDGVAAAAWVPEPGLVGQLDGRVREALRDALGRSAWLPRADGGPLAAPSELVAVEPSAPALVSVLADQLADLLPAEWLPRTPLLRGLGVSTRRWSDIWDALAPVPLPAETWHAVYTAAADLDHQSWEGLPILLADGRVVRDARQCVSPGEVPPEALRTLGLAVVAPGAMHPLLERIGVRAFDPRLHLDALPARVRETYPDDESEARELLAAAAEALADCGVPAGDLVRLGTTPVPTEDGTWRPASQVVLPGSPLAQVADAAALLDGTLASAHHDGWVVLGVLADLTVVPVADLAMAPDTWDLLMVDGGGWCEEVADLLGSDLPDDLLLASASLVRGVELLEHCSTATALSLLGVPEVRSAVVAPATVIDARGRTRSVRSPAAWWLSEAPLLGGRAPSTLRLPGDERLAPFFDPVAVPGDPDVELLEALGVHTTVEAWVERLDGPAELVSALADATIDIPDSVVGQLYSVLQRSDVDPESLDAPERVRALVDGRWQVVDAADVVVALAPHHAYVAGAPFVPGGVSLAELLDLDGTDDEWCGALDVQGSGTLREVPSTVSGHTSSESYREHAELSVAGRQVDWWVTDDGEVHACTLDGLACGLAWSEGRWGARFELMARLSAPSDPAREAVDAAYE